MFSFWGLLWVDAFLPEFVSDASVVSVLKVLFVGGLYVGFAVWYLGWLWFLLGLWWACN